MYHTVHFSVLGEGEQSTVAEYLYIYIAVLTPLCVLVYRLSPCSIPNFSFLSFFCLVLIVLIFVATWLFFGLAFNLT